MSFAVFTQFPTAKTTQGAVKIMTLKDLAALAAVSYKSKHAQPLCVPDQLPDDSRRAGNEPLASTAVFLDFDKPKLGFGAMHKLLAKLKIAYVLYPTFGWQVDAPKYRVVLPLRKPMEPHLRRELIARVAAKLPGVSPETFDSKRGYFVGKNGTAIAPEVAWSDGQTAEEYKWPAAKAPVDVHEGRAISLAANPARRAQDLFATLGRKLKDGDGRWSAVEYLATRVSARGYDEEQCNVFLGDMIARYFDQRDVGEDDRAKWQARIRHWLSKDMPKRQTAAPNPRVAPTHTGLPTTFSLGELLDMDLPPIEWIANGLLPPRLALLAGAPKTGKSQLAYDLALAVASGTPFLGQFGTVPSKVVYYDLETGHHLLLKRISALIKARKLDRKLIEANVSFSLIAARGGDAIGQLRADLAATPDIRLIVVDIFAAIRDGAMENRNRASAYQIDHDVMRQFSDLCMDHPHLCILLVHHTNKRAANMVNDWQDSISGTHGITGTTHTNMLLERPSKQGVTEEDAAIMDKLLVLHVQGKDVNRADYTLSQTGDGSTWEISEKTPQQARATTHQHKIIAFLKGNAGKWSAREVAASLGANTNTTSTIMKRMTAQGMIQCPTGKGYCLPQSTDEERGARSPRVGRKTDVRPLH
jgi:hypothetical protein